MQSSIFQAKSLLATARHAAMATVNADGSPHNTPYRLLFDDELEYFYWVSQPEAVHSQNIDRTGQAFVVVYDAKDKGGVYIKLQDCRKLELNEIDAGLAVHNAARKQEGKDPIDRSYYEDKNATHRMYRGHATNFWVYVVERDPQTGYVTKDGRVEVDRKDLIK
jgi:hypothetical protein